MKQNINNVKTKVLCQNSTDFLAGKQEPQFDLTFLDPPFNQGKDYQLHNDAMPEDEYWNWMQEVSLRIFDNSSEGAALYFMHREKNTERVLQVVRASGWKLQNLIIWKKKTSAIPSNSRFGKQYQIIVFATKGIRPRVFNKLRIDPPLPPEYKVQRNNGVFLTDIWDDIREMTAGYLSGKEALRDINGDRVHNQQSPVHLLLRIILSSSLPNDNIFDPFSGTGTTLVVAEQLGRSTVGIEIDPENVEVIKGRLRSKRESDSVLKWYNYYRHTPDIETIWLNTNEPDAVTKSEKQLSILN